MPLSEFNLEAIRDAEIMDTALVGDDRTKAKLGIESEKTEDGWVWHKPGQEGQEGHPHTGVGGLPAPKRVPRCFGRSGKQGQWPQTDEADFKADKPCAPTHGRDEQGCQQAAWPAEVLGACPCSERVGGHSILAQADPFGRGCR